MSNTEEFHPLPQPNEISLREREDAMGAYLMMFAAVAAGLPLPIINLIAALIYYFINKSKSRFVHFHSLQSLYSQFPTSILNGGMVFLMVRIWFFDWEWNDYGKGYLGIVIVANLIYFAFSIVAAVNARKGRFYYFLFFGKLTYQQVYKIKGEKEITDQVNLPPEI